MLRRGHPVKVLDLSWNHIDSKAFSLFLPGLYAPYCGLQVLKLAGLSPSGVVKEQMEALSEAFKHNTSLLSVSLADNMLDSHSAKFIASFLSETVPLPPLPPPSYSNSSNSQHSSPESNLTKQEKDEKEQEIKLNKINYSNDNQSLTQTLHSSQPHTSQIANLDLKHNNLKVYLYIYLSLFMVIYLFIFFIFFLYINIYIYPLSLSS